jgi:hypothetical protein
MDVALYTGNGTTQSITGLAFSPDFVWIKCRSSANGHALMDVVRGSSQRLFSELTDAEDSTASLTSFDSNGFSVSTVGGVSGRTNQSSQTYAGWCWDAGASTVSNTQGSITSQVRANPTAGFSVVTLDTASFGTSATVGHGLGVAPSFYIVKPRDFAGVDWHSYHISLGNTQRISLNSTAAAVTSPFWNNTSPTSAVFSLGGAWSTIGRLVAYCFSPVVGYSNFGSYVGNGSATDGPFVYTGLRSRWILLKCSSASGFRWLVWDSVRDTYNLTTTGLAPNLSDSELTGFDVDIVSNGFKLRDAENTLNQSGSTYIYAAFAESPFNYSRAR